MSTMSEFIDLESSEDILNESLAFLGGEQVVDTDVVTYGPLTLRIAPKEGKANTLLADHLFSPALFLAERIERGLFPVRDLTVIELGAGSGLPSLLTATTSEHPSLVVLTDYPDLNILGNLKNNVEQNRHSFRPACRVECVGYDWGTNADELLNLLPKDTPAPLGYDVMILSDLLHFHGSHDVLIDSVRFLLLKSKSSRLHVSAGNYTHSEVCDNFLAQGRNAGLVFEEILASPEEVQWLGKMNVSGLDNEALSLRKANCRYWIGQWRSETP